MKRTPLSVHSRVLIITLYLLGYSGSHSSLTFCNVRHHEWASARDGSAFALSTEKQIPRAQTRGARNDNSYVRAKPASTPEVSSVKTHARPTSRAPRAHRSR